MENIDSLVVAFDYIKENFSLNIFDFNDKQMKEYKKLLEVFINTNSGNCSTSEKGRALETLVKYLLDQTGIFEVYGNIRTKTNELDQLIRCNEKGKFLISNGLFSDKFGDFIGECKNYKSKVSVTYVGKICSLMSTTQNRLCLLFSYNGITGSGWNYGSGIVKKFYLSKEKLDDRYCIIDFNIEDFEKIRDGNNLIKIVEDKMFALQNDVDFSKFVSRHDCEKKIKEIQNR